MAFFALTPFLAPAGLRAPMVDFLGSDTLTASVGDMLRAASTLGAPSTSAANTQEGHEVVRFCRYL